MLSGWIRHGTTVHCTLRRTSATSVLTTQRFRALGYLVRADIHLRRGLHENHQLVGRSFRTYSTSSQRPSDDGKKEAPIRNRRDLLISWMHQLRSPPNIITSMRILSTPYLSYLIVAEHYEWALCGCFVASASDLIDGWIARTFSMNTVLGSYLDPLADKTLVNTVAVSLWYVELLPTPLVALWALRDVGLCIGTYRYVALMTEKERYVANPGTTPLKVSATRISKVNTGMQFITLSAALLQPIYGMDPIMLQSFW